MNDIVRFQRNVPVRLALAYGEPKIIEQKFGKRAMFTLVGGRVMFLKLDVAEKVNRLGVKAREPFWLCRTHSAQKGALDYWRAWRPEDQPGIGEQADGTFVVGVSDVPPVDSGANAPSKPGKPAGSNGNGDTPEPPIDIHNGWAQFLLAATNALVDVYAAAIHYATLKHHGQVMPEDVRALLIAAWAAQTRKGGPDVA
jgi:hypothetical protein